MPVPAEQLPTGTVIVHDQPEKERNGAALYAWVSSADQKSDLDRQLARLTEYAAAKKWVVVDAVKEIGSGLNEKRSARSRAQKALEAIQNG
jgi:predicted site-specific integrase-resolvase